MAKKLAFSRYIWFIDQARRDRFPNARSLSEEFEISRVQAQRDVEFMRDLLRVPMEYDYGEKGYKLAEKKFCLPSVWIEENELLLLAVAKELLRDRDAKAMLDEFFDKILLLSTPESLEALAGLVSYKGSCYYRQPRGVLKDLIPILLAGRQALVEYQPVFSTDHKKGELTISPRHLVFYRSNWYLLAHYKENLRTFSLSRLLRVKMLEEPAPDFAEAEIRQCIEQAFGIFITDQHRPLREVRLRFSARLAQFIETLVFHREQKLRKLDDGGLEISFNSTINRELVGEILRYIDEVDILEPEELRLEVRQVMERGLRRLT